MTDFVETSASRSKPRPPPPPPKAYQQEETANHLSNSLPSNPPPPPPISSSNRNSTSKLEKVVKVTKGDPSKAPPPPPPLPLASYQSSTTENIANPTSKRDSAKDYNHVSDDSSNIPKKVRFNVTEKEEVKQEEDHKEEDEEAASKEDDTQFNKFFNEVADPQKLEMFRLFQIVEGLSNGTYMKLNVGVAGDTPAKDSFPMFKSSKKYMYVHWGTHILIEDWCIAFFEKPAHQNDKKNNKKRRASINTAHKTVSLSDISEVYLDSKSTTSFRFYCGQEVTQCTPVVSTSRQQSIIASHWADSIYSSIQIQSFAFDQEDMFQMYYTDFSQVHNTAGICNLFPLPIKDDNDEETDDQSGNEGGRKGAASKDEDDSKNKRKSIFSSMSSMVQRASVMISGSSVNETKKPIVIFDEINQSEEKSNHIEKPKAANSQDEKSNDDGERETSKEIPKGGKDKSLSTTPSKMTRRWSTFSDPASQTKKNKHDTSTPLGELFRSKSEDKNFSPTFQKSPPKKISKIMEEANEDKNYSSDENSKPKSSSPRVRNTADKEEEEEETVYPTFSSDFLSQSLLSSNQQKFQQRKSFIKVTENTHSHDEDFDKETEERAVPISINNLSDISPVAEEKSAKVEEMNEKYHQYDDRMLATSTPTPTGDAIATRTESNEESHVSEPLVKNRKSVAPLPLSGSNDVAVNNVTTTTTEHHESSIPLQQSADTAHGKAKRNTILKPSTTAKLFSDDFVVQFQASVNTTPANIITPAAPSMEPKLTIGKGPEQSHIRSIPVIFRDISPHKQLGTKTVLDNLYESSIEAQKQLPPILLSPTATLEERQQAWLNRQQTHKFAPGAKIYTFPFKTRLELSQSHSESEPQNEIIKKYLELHQLEQQYSPNPRIASPGRTPRHPSPNRRRKAEDKKKPFFSDDDREDEEDDSSDAKHGTLSSSSNHKGKNAVKPRGKSGSTPKREQGLINFLTGKVQAVQLTSTTHVESDVEEHEEEGTGSDIVKVMATPKTHKKSKPIKTLEEKEKKKTNSKVDESPTKETGKSSSHYKQPPQVKSHHINVEDSDDTTSVDLTVHSPVPTTEHVPAGTVTPPPLPSTPKRSPFATVEFTQPTTTTIPTIRDGSSNSGSSGSSNDSSNQHPVVSTEHPFAHAGNMTYKYLKTNNNSNNNNSNGLASTWNGSVYNHPPSQSPPLSSVGRATFPGPKAGAGAHSMHMQDAVVQTSNSIQSPSSSIQSMSSPSSYATDLAASLFVEFNNQIISLTLLTKTELKQKVVSITTITTSSMNKTGLQTTFMTHQCTPLPHKEQPQNSPISASTNDKQKRLRDPRIPPQPHEIVSTLLQERPGLFQVSSSVLTLTMTMILAEHLESEYYLELANISSDMNELDEYVYVPLQDLLNIEVDPRTTGFFRMQLWLNSLTNPIVYSLTTPMNSLLSQENPSSIPTIPKDHEAKRIVNRLFDNILEAKMQKSPSMKKENEFSATGYGNDSSEIEYVSCVMKGIEVNGLLSWLQNIIKIRKEMMKKL